MTASTPPNVAGVLAPATEEVRERAWDEFLAGHSRLLMYVARSFGGDYDAGMDRYALLLEQLRRDNFKRLRAFADDGRSDFTTWLVVVAQRICLDHRRSLYGRNRNPDGTISFQFLARRRLADLIGVPLEKVELAQPDSIPADQLLVVEETSAALKSALARLSAHDQLLVQLRFEDGLPMPRIASVLGYRTRFHAYRQLERALETLKVELASRGIYNHDA